MYEMKTKPFSHQAASFEAGKDERIWGYFFEQGTGKSKLVIDEAGHLFLEGRIDAVIVIAPNGVHQNWDTDELPTHLGVPYHAHTWQSKRASTKWHQAAAKRLLSRGFPWLLMSYDGFMTKAGRKFADEFKKARNTLIILDESQRIKTPSAKRTQALVRWGKGGKVRRVLSGTPVTNTPFDIYPQLKFLDVNFWKSHGFASYEAFKTHFGVWQEFALAPKSCPKCPAGGQCKRCKLGSRFRKVVDFKNLDQLAQIVRTVSSRVLKEDVLDLPPKVYTKRYVDLSPEQRRLYDGLKAEMMVELQSGELITTPMAVTRLLRFQQILSGYLPSDDCEELNPLDENPRHKLLLDILENDVEGKALIFSRFRPDIDLIVQSLGSDCVRYDGAVGDDERLAARRAFQDPAGPRYFVGNPAACSTGLTLTAANTVIYYANSFVLEQRLQSEDRAHRIGQTRSVNYIDIVAAGTVDEHIVKSLRSKYNIAAAVNADKLREWI